MDVAAITRPVYDTVHHFTGEADSLANYILVLDAINFGSGYFPHLQKRATASGQRMSGYFTVASYLKDYFEVHGPPTPQTLQTLTQADCANIFQQDLEDDIRAELMGLFARALYDLGEVLLENYGGSSVQFVEAANHSAEALATQLTAMPFFQDAANYNSIPIPIYKRAQIAVSDLALAFDNQNLGYFEDINQLTIFADNLVPHVLHVDGLLTYSEELEGMLEAGQLLPAGSDMEIELRAVSIHTVELMVESLRAQGQQVSTRELDMLLWNQGQAAHYRQTTPPPHAHCLLLTLWCLWASYRNNHAIQQTTHSVDGISLSPHPPFLQNDV
ncbi:MAG: queuosine salvage family protein [Deinococcota bacterium]